MEEKHGYYLEDLSVGMTSVYAKTVTDADIVMFAGISGDTNPVHLDALFADQTAFKGRIAHGMLSASFISTVLGTRLPGPGCIYVSQSLRFRAPVKAGDTVTARVTIRDIDEERKRIIVDTVCTVGDTVVIDGEAMLMVSRRLSERPQGAANDAAANGSSGGVSAGVSDGVSDGAAAGVSAAG